MYRAPTEDSDSEDEPCARFENRGRWFHHAAAAPAVSAHQHSPCHAFLVRTHSASAGKTCSISADKRTARTASGGLGSGLRCNTAPQPYANEGTARILQAQKAKRMLGLLHQPHPSAAHNQSSMHGTTSSLFGAVNVEDVSGHPSAPLQQTEPCQNTPATAAGKAPMANSEPAMQHLQQWAAMFQNGLHSSASKMPAAHATERGNKRHEPTAGSANGMDAFLHACVQSTAGAVPTALKGPGAAAAAAEAAATGTAQVDIEGDGDQPSAPPLECLFAQQQQQQTQQQLQEQHHQWASSADYVASPMHAAEPARVQQQAAAAVHVSVAQCITPKRKIEQERQGHECDGLNHEAQRRRITEPAEQQQGPPDQAEQQRHTTCGSKRLHEEHMAAAAAAATTAEWSTWQWPTSRKRQASAGAAGDTYIAAGTSVTVGRGTCQQHDARLQIDPAVAAAVAAATAAAATATATSVSMDPSGNVSTPVAGQSAAAAPQQTHKRGAESQHESGPGTNSAAKRWHAEAGAAAACNTSGAAAAAAESYEDAHAGSEEGMPQAAFVTHKRQQPSGTSTGQQQPAMKMPRYGSGNSNAAAAADDSSAMDAEFLQEQQPQHTPAGTSAGFASAAGSNSTCSAAVLAALQQAYPPLAAVLCAVHAGGLSAVLAGPYGRAVSALMSRTTGRQLLMAFAELAADESLLMTAVQQSQLPGQQAMPGQPRSPDQGRIPAHQQGMPGQQGVRTPSAAGMTGGQAGGSFAEPSTPVTPVQRALQNLQCSIANSQHDAAGQILASLSLAFELHQEGLDAVDTALQMQAMQLQQQQHLAQSLQEKLVLAEQQLKHEIQQRQSQEAATTAANQALHEAQEKLEHVTMCQICFEQPRDTVLMPCMHFLYCAGCMRKGLEAAAAAAKAGKEADVLRCPVCRVPVSGQVVVHLSPTTG